MRIGKFILRTVLFLLLAAAVGAGLYLYPAWKAAKALGDEMELPCKAFVLEVELDRDAVPREQEKMLGMLAKLTGIPEDAMYRLSIEGSAMEGKVHLLICPDGRTEPLIELYLSDDMSVINETMLYSAIRGNLTEKLGLLDYLMPRQEETVYMTLEQVEQLFGADLSGIGDMRLPAPEKEIGAGEYFLLLAVMAREKSGNGYSFALEREQMSLGFDVADGAPNTGSGTGPCQGRQAASLAGEGAAQGGEAPGGDAGREEPFCDVDAAGGRKPDDSHEPGKPRYHKCVIEYRGRRDRQPVGGGAPAPGGERREVLDGGEAGDRYSAADGKRRCQGGDACDGAGALCL